MSEKFIMDRRILKKIINNDYFCLCTLNEECPCVGFLTHGACKCGLYTLLENERT